MITPDETTPLTSEPSSAPLECGSLVHENYSRAVGGEKPRPMYEVPLYSDTLVVAEARGVGPYDILNAISPNTPSFQVDPTIFVRVRLHGENWLMPKTVDGDTGVDHVNSRYHGGSHDDELAALLSLFLGIRLKAGDPSRWFFGEDPLGRPQADQRRPDAHLRPKHREVILPLLKHGPQLNEAARLLKLFASNSAPFSIAFAKAARLYQEAVWIVESEPQRAWLALISAIESGAVFEQQGDDDPVKALWKVRKSLAKLLNHDQELLRRVAKDLRRMFGATSRFIDFALKYAPAPPLLRPPPGPGRVEWTKEGIRNVASVLYDARSRTLHDGTGFPGPLCAPPLKIQDWEAPEERPSACAHAHAGGSWLPEDLPISFHTFHHLVRGALLNWLTNTTDQLESAAASDTTAPAIEDPPHGCSERRF